MFLGRGVGAALVRSVCLNELADGLVVAIQGITDDIGGVPVAMTVARVLEASRGASIPRGISTPVITGNAFEGSFAFTL